MSSLRKNIETVLECRVFNVISDVVWLSLLTLQSLPPKTNINDFSSQKYKSVFNSTEFVSNKKKTVQVPVKSVIGNIHRINVIYESSMEHCVYSGQSK